MNKDHKAFEKWCAPHLKRLQKVLLLTDHFPLEIKYGTNDKDAHAECECSYPYKTATIRYSDYLLTDWNNKQYSQVIDVLTHELCHLITDPLYIKAIGRYSSKQEINDERERLTDHIANIVRHHNL